MKIQLKRSNVLTGGFAKEPTASQLEYGELAINYNTDDPAIFLKDSNNNIIRISGVGNIADDGQVELPASTTPPSNPLPGNLWYNSDDGRLYIYYADADTEQWVDASPDSWDPTILPDPNDNSSQAGTLDDRYLMLNAANDPVTGGLNITGGDVGIGTTSPDAALEVVRSSAGEVELARFRIEGQTNNPMLRFLSDESQKILTIGTSGSVSGTVLAFDTQSGEAMRIGATGNIGIGTSNPIAKLHTSGTVLHEGDVEIRPQNTGGEGGQITLKNPDKTSTGAIIDVSTANAFRIFQLNNNSIMELGQLAGTGGTIKFATSGSERLRITSTGFVGIGTDSPAQLLELSSSFPRLRITDNDTTAGNGSQSYLEFYGSDSRSGIIYTDSSGLNIWADSNGGGDLLFKTGTSTKMRILSGGNVGIGVTSPAHKLHVNGNFTANNYFIGNSTSNTASGTIGNSTVAGYMQLWGTNTAQNGAVLFGTAQGSAGEIARFTEHGLNFDRNNSAINSLDDYEEGSWTPTLISDGTSGGVVYGGGNNGRYVKIGQQVTLQCSLQWTTNSVGGATFTKIGGLPFANSSSNKGRAGTSVGFDSGFPNVGAQIMLRSDVGAAAIIVGEKTGMDGATSNIALSSLNNSGLLLFSYTYFTGI